MIQRIQTVYMLLSAAVCVLCLTQPVGRFTVAGENMGDLYNLWLSVTHPASGAVVHQLTPWVAGFVLLVLVATFTLLNILLYKKRALQMRVLLYGMIVLAGYYVVQGVFVWRLCQEQGFSFRPTVYAALPLVALVLNFLAFRGVDQDDMLVKSLDRLR